MEKTFYGIIKRKKYKDDKASKEQQEEVLERSIEESTDGITEEEVNRTID